jgi:hypothetical protein
LLVHNARGKDEEGDQRENKENEEVPEELTEHLFF